MLLKAVGSVFSKCALECRQAGVSIQSNGLGAASGGGLLTTHNQDLKESTVDEKT